MVDPRHLQLCVTAPSATTLVREKHGLVSPLMVQKRQTQPRPALRAWLWIRPPATRGPRERRLLWHFHDGWGLRGLGSTDLSLRAAFFTSGWAALGKVATKFQLAVSIRTRPAAVRQALGQRERSRRPLAGWLTCPGPWPLALVPPRPDSPVL